ncbi:MAG: GIY-YIG nuclease family protein [Candidatus Hadarchaeia archaeon]
MDKDSEFYFIPQFDSLEKLFKRGIIDKLEIDIFNSIEDVDSDYRGNYLFFSEDSECLYIGQTEYSIKNRINKHIKDWKSNKRTIDKLNEEQKNHYEDNPSYYAVKGTEIDAVLDKVEFVLTIKNLDSRVWEKFLIKELNPKHNKNTYLPKPECENPSCPDCGRKLYWRKRERGFVCKNWRCDNYHKLGGGYVFDKNGDIK